MRTIFKKRQEYYKAINAQKELAKEKVEEVVEEKVEEVVEEKKTRKKKD